MASDQTSINSVSSNLLAKALQDVKQTQDKQAVSSEIKNPKPQQDSQSSTVVKLSAEGQRLSRSEPNSAQNAKPQNDQQATQKNAEPPGIKFMESKSHGGRVSTYA